MALLLLVAGSTRRSSVGAGNPNEPPAIEAEQQKPLELKHWLEREITPGQTHHYQIPIRARQYFTVEIEHWGLDLTGTLSSPGAQAQTKFICNRDDRTLASAISQVTGHYTLALQVNAAGSKLTRYRIRLRVVRPRIKGDEDRLALERVLAEAEQLKTKIKKESYEQALEKYREALPLARSLPDREFEIAVLTNLGETFEALNENAKALAQYNAARAACKRAGLVRQEADITNRLAHYYFNNGNNRQAQTAATAALHLSRATGSQNLEGDALFVLGEAYYGLGDLPLALDYYLKALKIKRNLSDYQGQIAILISTGYTYSALSETAKARDAYSEAHSLSLHTENRIWEARSLRALGAFHTRLGEYQRALDLFREALEIFNVVDDRLTQATVLAGIGFTYENLGEKEKALAYDDEAIAMIREIGSLWPEAELQMDSGRVHFSLGQNSKALERYQRALELFRSLGITRMAARTLRDIGRVYEADGDAQQALGFYHQSLAISRKGQDQREVAYTLNYVGRLQERSGDRRRAQAYYEEALRLNRQADDPAGEAFTLFQIARAQRDLGNLEAALPQIENSVRLTESLRTKVASRDVRASLVASTHHYYELHADILMLLHRQQPSQDFAKKSFEATEKARARSFVESLREVPPDLRQDVDPVLLEREKTLEKMLEAKLGQRSELSRKRDDITALTREIDQLTAEYDSIRAQIEIKSPRYSALTQPQPFTLEEIQQRILDADSILLEYMLGEDRSYVWAVTRTGISGYELPGRAEIEAAAQKFRQLLMSNQAVDGETLQQRQARIREADAELPGIAAKLGDMLIAPVQPRGQKKRLIIVPDGALHYIPFQALSVTPAGQPGERQPLLVEYEIVYEPSASTLALVLEDRTRREAKKTIAVFANPVFEADDLRVRRAAANVNDESAPKASIEQVFRDPGLPGDRIRPLPASRDEAERILSLVPPGTSLKALDFDANVAAVTKPELAQYRFVHFATHGFVDYEQPELSGLVLSLVDKTGQPQAGFLRLHDIYKLKLSANLVVLSACDTGIGKEIKGEGLIGLTRGFMYAGAGGVAASLWKVDDDATAELMAHFYEGMFKKGLTPSAAMREAQLSMLRQKRWQAPYYWAAFIIHGRYDQSENIAPSRAQWAVASAGLLSAVLLGACIFIRKKTNPHRLGTIRGIAKA